MPRNFGIYVGHREKEDSGSKGFFLDIFPKELPGFSLDEEIEFGIDVPQLFQKGMIGWRKFEDEFS